MIGGNELSHEGPKSAAFFVETIEILPVAMMGPSAPKEPPVPIEMAADRGLRINILGDIFPIWLIMLPIASGRPWPLISGHPYLAKRLCRQLRNVDTRLAH